MVFLLVLVCAVFKVFPQDRLLQRFLLQNAVLSRLWSESSTFPVEVFIAQVRVHPLCTFQLVFLKSWMSLVKVFFPLFPNLFRKNAASASSPSPRVPASVSPSTPSAQQEGFFIDENDDVWMRLPSGQWTLLGSDQHVLRDEPG